MMGRKRYDRNLIVIGAGAGGLVSAYIAAAVKAKVTLVEAHRMGGDCLNYGCVPSKALIQSAKIAHQMRHASRYGLTDTTPQIDFKSVMARVHRVIAQIEPHDSVARYTELGVDVVQGRAHIVDPHTVDITLPDGQMQRLTSRAIIVATGAAPFVPPLPGIEQSSCVTSDTLWERFAQLDEVPKRLLVLGGGPIGCELAQAFARLGSAVTLVEMAERLLVREDVEVSSHARSCLELDGVRVLAGHRAVRCGTSTEQGGGKTLTVQSPSGEALELPYDQLICAVGRSARLHGYGLEGLGIVQPGKHRVIPTNAYLQTAHPSIFAAGDVVGPYQFTHVAAHQAWYAAVNALFGSFKKFKVDYRVIPMVTFLDPEIARVGLNEQDAQAQGLAYEVTRYGIDDLDRAITEGHTEGFVKVLTVPGKDRILGVTIIAAHAGELLAEFVLAMRHGLGLEKLLATIHAYPTLAEANKYAAGQWKRDHAPKRLLVWLERFHTWRR